ncbi:hypothetical protein A3F65_03835 [Candidatus Saccharibacteria bacterium RIFCSPHIGHO2_12_FULL_47_16b]|nr:MAG: hypothetical protein A3F65_03835 [Candidatus Saccharibacteria bacterium RIFCSPHIGHO2_12_FULL_47_16b]OGL38887.1 MAG: hypothetical protein A3J32_01130 [Candidatus Saccharibacteria bacterium RIFCSPLOWO2_02_FULL_46_7]
MFIFRLCEPITASSHLDAVQGRVEDLYFAVYEHTARRSTAGSDAVMRQEPPVQPARLAGRAAVRSMR